MMHPSSRNTFHFQPLSLPPSVPLTETTQSSPISPLLEFILMKEQNQYLF